MAHPFGVSWLCALLWGCICFLPQKGYNIADGYSLNDNPQTSNQFQSETFLNSNHEDRTQTIGHQSWSQREPVHSENIEDVTSLGEEIVQHKPDSEQEQEEFLAVPFVPSVQKYEHSSSDYHPFGLLLKEHTPTKNVEGISFPTIRDFRYFIETMKSSFLTPGSDLVSPFQTAWETIKDQLTSGAKNIYGESSTRSDSTQGSAHDDNSKNEIWSEPTNTMLEQHDPDANYQKPREGLSFHEPINPTSPSVYDNQDYGPISALYPHHNFARPQHVLSNYGSLANGGISGENPEIFANAPDSQNEDIQSTGHKVPQQIPSGSFYVEDFSDGSNVTASLINPQNRPSHPIGYSSKSSNIKHSENIQQPTYSSHSRDSLTGYQKPSGGFEIGKDFQRDELHRVTQADVLSPQKFPSFNSYGKSVYVSAPQGQLYIPNQSKHRERPAKTVQTYQPTVGKELKGINYSPTTIHLPVSTGSMSSNVDVQASIPNDSQHQVFSRKQPLRSHLMFLKPSSSHHDSSSHDVFVRKPSVIHVPQPPSLTTQAKDDEGSYLSKQTLVPDIQEPKQMYDNTHTSSGLDSTQSGIASQVGEVYISFSPPNLAPTSVPKRAFSRLIGNEVISRDSEIKNIMSDRFGGEHGPRNPLDLFSTRQRPGISLSATKADLLQTFVQPTRVQRRLTKLSKEPINMAYQFTKPLRVEPDNLITYSGVFWRNRGNTRMFPPQTGPSMSPPPVNTRVRTSRGSYARRKVSLSKTYYTPYQHVEGNSAKDQWKPVPRKGKPLLTPTM